MTQTSLLFNHRFSTLLRNRTHICFLTNKSYFNHVFIRFVGGDKPMGHALKVLNALSKTEAASFKVTPQANFLGITSNSPASATPLSVDHASSKSSEPVVHQGPKVPTKFTPISSVRDKVPAHILSGSVMPNIPTQGTKVCEPTKVSQQERPISYEAAYLKKDATVVTEYIDIDGHIAVSVLFCQDPLCLGINCSKNIFAPCHIHKLTQSIEIIGNLTTFPPTSVPENHTVELDPNSNASGESKPQSLVTEPNPLKETQTSTVTRLDAQTAWLNEDVTHTKLTEALPVNSTPYQNHLQHHKDDTQI